MKKLIFLLILLVLLTACHNELVEKNNGTGTVTLETSLSRGVSASIDWVSLTDKVWNLTATKTDSGETQGQGEYNEIVLTDTLSPFSVGDWEFTITDTTGKWTGTVETSIHVGNNTIAFSIHSTTNKGTLVVEDCNFLASKAGAVSSVDCYVDDSKINGTNWIVSQSMTTDGELYTLPTLTKQYAGGIHTIRLYYSNNDGGFSSDTYSFRIINGLSTHITIGEQEGNATLSVFFDEVNALIDS